VPTLRSAIVGCGPRGIEHGEAIAATSMLALCGAADPQELARRRFQAATGCDALFSSVDDMLVSLEPDLVHVATGPHDRWSVLERVVATKAPPKAVLVEKPFALSPGEARLIENECGRSGVGLYVNHQMRFHQLIPRICSRLEGGELGAVVLVRASTRYNLLEQGTHLFDLVSAMFSDRIRLQAVFAQAGGRERRERVAPGPAETAGVATTDAGWRLYFECGPNATARPRAGETSGSASDDPSSHLGIEVCCAGGILGFSLNRGSWVSTLDHTSADEIVYWPDEYKAAQVRLLESLGTAIAEGSDHPSAIARARWSFDAVMAAQRSALHHRWVDVESLPTDTEIEALHRSLA
jgi:predicted dehydrogenase